MIWNSSPAHRGDALRAYLTTPDLNLRLVNPVSSTGPALPSYSPDFKAPILDQSRHLGLGMSGGDHQPVPGYPCRSPGNGRRLLHRPGPPTRRSQAAMPDRPSGLRSRTDSHRLSRFSPSHQCRSHFGFSLGSRLEPLRQGLCCYRASGVPRQLYLPICRQLVLPIDLLLLAALLGRAGEVDGA